MVVGGHENAAYLCYVAAMFGSKTSEFNAVSQFMSLKVKAIHVQAWTGP